MQQVTLLSVNAVAKLVGVENTAPVALRSSPKFLVGLRYLALLLRRQSTIILVQAVRLFCWPGSQMLVRLHPAEHLLLLRGREAIELLQDDSASSFASQESGSKHRVALQLLLLLGGRKLAVLPQPVAVMRARAVKVYLGAGCWRYLATFPSGCCPRAQRPGTTVLCWKRRAFLLPETVPAAGGVPPTIATAARMFKQRASFNSFPSVVVQSVEIRKQVGVIIQIL